MLILYLKPVKDFILRFSINGSFFLMYTPLSNLLGFFSFFFFFFLLFIWRFWWGIDEVLVNRANYPWCQFDVLLIQCQTSIDISGIALFQKIGGWGHGISRGTKKIACQIPGVNEKKVKFPGVIKKIMWNFHGSWFLRSHCITLFCKISRD